MTAHDSSIAELTSVTFRYGKVKALDGVDLALAAGKVTALLGPNGAGKSTLIHLLLGLLPVQRGSITIFGGSPQARSARERVGAMLQISGVQDNLTVLELIRLFASLYPRPAAPERLVEEAGLHGLEQRRFARLSGGQKQRLLFALALVGNPDLLILDEPTAGLDPAARQRLWRVIEQRRAEGTSILLCTHYLDEAARLADRVVVLHGGRKLTEGTPDSIRSHVPSSLIRARSSMTATAIQSIEAVSRVERLDDHVQVMSSDPTATLKGWLASDAHLEIMDVTGADLETAFMALIKNEEDPETSLTEAA